MASDHPHSSTRTGAPASYPYFGFGLCSESCQAPGRLQTTRLHNLADQGFQRNRTLWRDDAGKTLWSEFAVGIGHIVPDAGAIQFGDSISSRAAYRQVSRNGVPFVVGNDAGCVDAARQPTRGQIFFHTKRDKPSGVYPTAHAGIGGMVASSGS